MAVDLEDAPHCNCGDEIVNTTGDEMNDGRCIDCAFALERRIEELKAELEKLRAEGAEENARLKGALDNKLGWDEAVADASNEWDADATSASIGIERYRVRLYAALRGEHI